jgi:hypothetical protein
MMQGVDRKRTVRHRVHVHHFSHLALISDIPEKATFWLPFSVFSGRLTIGNPIVAYIKRHTHFASPERRSYDPF